MKKEFVTTGLTPELDNPEADRNKAKKLMHQSIIKQTLTSQIERKKATEA